QNTPAGVTLESYEMERTMRRLGWRVIRMSGADLKLMHDLADGRVVQIDIFGAFHVGDTFYQLGGRSGHLPPAALTPASTVTLEGVELPAPADPEAVLAFLYGPSWRVPDPAFQPDEPVAGLRRLDGWLRGVRTDVMAWNQFYRARRSDIPSGPSAFAEWTCEQVGPRATIADLGCGTGRDSVWMTEQGHQVMSFDIAGSALWQTGRRMELAGAQPGTVRTLALNDRRSVLVAGAELARTRAPVNLYARGLVGCLDEEATEHLFLLASMSLRRGGSLFLEFSTGAGPTPDPAHLIRRRPVDEVVAAIASRAGTVDLVEIAPGLDFFDRPDRSIARIVAHWAPPTSSREKDQP
ncbi:MAG: SAM-dependent methyltransferase, partial [Marmoricola sp.]|nr:SAM-dependent methyltransferase [Marmoricola sp.]